MGTAVLASIVARLALAIGLTSLGVEKIVADQTPSHSTEWGLLLWFVGWIEAGSGVTLVLSLRPWATWLASGLVGALVAGALMMWLAGADLHSCGCFGHRAVSAENHVVVLWSLVALAVISGTSAKTLSHWAAAS